MHNISKCSQFKHLLYSLCSIVNVIFSIFSMFYCECYILYVLYVLFSHNIITSTGLNLINCKHIHYSPSSTLLLCLHTRYNLFAHSLAHPCFFINIYYSQYTVLHILSHCTSYSFYFIICPPLFIPTYIYIYIFSCVMFLCFYCLCYFYFIFYLISIHDFTLTSTSTINVMRIWRVW